MFRIKLLVPFWWVFLSSIIACSGLPQIQPAGLNNASPAPTRVVLRILNLDLALTALPTQISPAPFATPEPVILPSATPSPVSISQKTAGSPTPSCFNRAEFVKHLTISDNTALEAGQSFMKVWRIKNSGTCTWNTDYILVFFSGDEMGAPHSNSLPHPVAPGEMIDLQIAMTAPMNAITVSGNWVLQDANGNIFGVGETADRPIAVTIVVKPTPRPSPS